MALAMSVVVFCGALSDAGLGRSLIRTPVFDRDEWSTVFWFLVVLGFGFAGAIVLVSPLWASMFDTPELLPILMALSVVPMMQAFTSAPNAAVERQENYTGIATVQVVTTVLSMIVAVLLAYRGFGVWALVFQQISIPFVRMLGIFYLSAFRPGLTFKPSLLGQHLLFARDAVLISAVAAMRTQAVTVMVGGLLGTQALGLYSMCERFLRLPKFALAGPMSSVVYVRMAKAQSDPEKVAEIYLASVRLLSFALLPGIAILAVSGDAAFATFLSEKWAPIAFLFALAAPGLAIEAVTVVTLACVFRAYARTGRLFRLTFVGAALLIVLVGLAATVSIEAVALSLSVWGVAVTFISLREASNLFPIGVQDVLRVLYLPAVVSTSLASLVAVLRWSFALSDIQAICVATVVGCVGMAGYGLANRSALRIAIGTFRK